MFVSGGKRTVSGGTGAVSSGLIAKYIAARIAALIDLDARTWEKYVSSKSSIGAKNTTQTFSVRNLSGALGSWTSASKIADVRTTKWVFLAALVMGRNFFTPGHPGLRVGNVRRKFGPK